MKRVTHDPNALLDYRFDWSDFLAAGETITAHTVTITPNDATLISPSSSVDGEAVVVWLDNGTLGQVYTVNVAIETSAGRKEDADLLVRVTNEEAGPLGGCEWPVKYPEGCTLPPTTERAAFEEMAVEFLWRWTGRALGVCTATIRPCRVRLGHSPPFEGRGPLGRGGTPWHPVLIGGHWYNMGCGSCGFDACSCDGPALISLPGPVVAVTQVKVDGVVLDPANYRLDGSRWLVRTDGEVWPTSQNLAAADTEEGTWSVTYQRGTPVPAGGQIAAGVLASELHKAACNDQSCGLPKRFSSITRQGVTVAMLDSFDDIDKGHTGIFLIDSWVASMTQPPRRSTVLSPDYHPRHRSGV